jgi:serine/threonine-protein kinase
MARVEADRNLLFGILALQMDFISRDDLIAAMAAWVLQKHRPLADLLMERGALAAGDRSLLEPLVRRHVEQHGGDPSPSLASLSSLDWLRGDLAPAAGADPDLQATLDRLPRPGRGPGDDRQATTGYDGSPGPRFRILRPHARGGLGEVFVAEDAELHREVALKRIQGRHADHPESRSRFVLEAEVTGGLEHPGIVPVYSLGHDPDGRPYYAMRFIRGDSLKEAIERFHRGRVTGRPPGERMLGLQKLLRRFLEVCNAIAYAHSRGVLHRDLKPGNILVGPFGETLVVDWGLAKVVGTADPAGERTLRPPSASGSSATLPGAAIGTPAFMSPEQAEGRIDQLGPASDVYSLGATLYCLLTGRAPIDGSGLDVEEVLRRVRSGEVSPPRQVDPGVPRALEAICRKAMARDPADRYESPRGLAEDVERWLADEPVTAYSEPFTVRAGRWMRRNRTIVTTAAAASLVGLVTLGGAYLHVSAINGRLDEANRREIETNRQLQASNAHLKEANDKVSQAKAESDRRLVQALRAVEDYYNGVNEELLLGQEGLQGLRRRLLEKPRQFYEELARELEATPISDLRGRSLLAKGRSGLGRILHDLGRYNEAMMQFGAAIAVYTKSPSDQPDTLEDQNELAKCYLGLGATRASMGDLRGADESARQAVALGARLAADHPEVADFQVNLAKGYGNLGQAQRSLGDLRGALDSYRRAIVAFDRLTSGRPDDPAHRQGLAQSHANLSGIQTSLGDLSGAESSQRRALAILTNLAKNQPDNLEVQKLLAACNSSLGIVQASRGDSTGAADAFRRAIATGTRLATAQPNVPGHQNLLATYFNNLGNARSEASDLRGAAESYNEAIAIRNKLNSEHPGVPQFQYGQAMCYNNLGKTLTSIGDSAGASGAFREAIAIGTKLVASQPNVPTFQTELAKSHEFLGLLRNSTADSRGALECYREASAIYRKLAEAHPKVPTNRRDLAGSLGNLASAQSSTGDRAGAMVSLQEAIDLFAGLAAAQPDVPLYPRYLARCHVNLGLVQRSAGGLRDAEQSCRKAIEIATPLAATTPTDVDLQSVLGLSFQTLGLLLHDAGRYREAEEHFRRSIDHQRIAFNRANQVIEIRRRLSEQYLGLAKALRSLGRAEEAAQIVRERRRLWEKNPGELYGVACELALAIPLSNDFARQQALAAEATDALRAAIAAGWRDALHTGRDPDLIPLHDREDFRRLLADLFDRAFPADVFAR